MRFENLHDINTMCCADGEFMLSGTDSNGKNFTIVIPAYELLEWIDINYIKEQLKKHIDNLGNAEALNSRRDFKIDKHENS